MRAAAAAAAAVCLVVKAWARKASDISGPVMCHVSFGSDCTCGTLIDSFHNTKNGTHII